MKDFLDKKNVFAVVGVSLNHEKWGWKIFQELKSDGFKVYPVNPNHKKIENDACYSALNSLPLKPDVVITVVPPQVTEEIAKQCNKLGINKLWMQPGSESQKAIDFCKENNIEAIYNACFMLNKEG